MLVIEFAVPKPPKAGEINYMKKEDFGKVPEYLKQVKEEIRRENEMVYLVCEVVMLV